MKRFIIPGLLALAAAGLSACGGGGGGGGGTTTPPSASFASQFGAGFGAAFGASANSDPKELAAADVITPSLTADPVILPGT
ncbi:hypothetical protein BH11PSE1_BH11PSE1_05040 [soil metagenome]